MGTTKMADRIGKKLRMREQSTNDVVGAWPGDVDKLALNNSAEQSFEGAILSEKGTATQVTLEVV